MKKILLFLGLSFLALAACNKYNTTVQDAASGYDASKLVLDLNISYNETKAVKKDWTAGDKVFIFFNGKTTGYVTTTYDGSEWDTPVVNGTLTLDSSGDLFAVFFTFGSDAAPTYSDSWTFSGNTSSVYLNATSVAYKITNTGDMATLRTTAAINMAAPSGYVQFFVPDDSATGTISLACNNTKPAGVSSIAADGTVTELDGANGDFLTGYAATVEGEKGYYASGKVVSSPENVNYIAIENGSDYYDCYKSGTTLAGGNAVKLTKLNPVGEGAAYRQINATRWATVNYSAVKPWTYSETKYTWADACSIGSLPTKDQAEELYFDTEKEEISVAGVKGVVIKGSKYASDSYIFIPYAGYDATGVLEEVGKNSIIWTSSPASSTNAYAFHFRSWYPVEYGKNELDFSVRQCM